MFLIEISDKIPELKQAVTKVSQASDISIAFIVLYGVIYQKLRTV
jgi:hypothetical protein